ncbi:MAG TPA: SDR family oxidoreductase [Microbacteriaceae bacterium]|jgi:NAD(P)-dependent dehydrogenase (short-subunit alcohol dehydrogenase family)|nr:SDR family oxidoreductase [Microbacteriaceae bacterium]
MTRVAVVTGAAGGIGAATCDVLREQGWQVIAVDRKPIDHPDAVELDVSDAETVASTFASLERVDGLVNNAAIQLKKALVDTTVEEWDDVWASNLRSAFVCLKALVPQLAASGGGAVVNVSSVHATASSSSVTAYAASKGGLVAFTRAAAIELATDGIRVNAVLPGAIDTPMLLEGFAGSKDSEATLLGRTPLRRLGQPREIAEAIAFLLDPDRAAFITGQTLVADGGALARLSTE